MNRKRVAASLIIAVAMFAITASGRFNLGNMGYLNLSEAVIMVTMTHMSPGLALLISAAATAGADLVSGYGQYATYTFIIKGLEGFAVALLANKNKSELLTAVTVSLLCIGGYGLADMLMYGGWQIFLISMGNNLVQAVICSLVALIVNPRLKTIKDKYFN